MNTHPVEPSASTSDHNRELEALLEKTVDSWNRHDMHDYASCFAHDADFVNVLGQRYTGRDSIEAQHVAIHKTIMRASEIWTTRHTVRYLAPEVALVHLNWGMRGHQAPADWKLPEVREGILTLVVTRRGGEWLIAAAQNTDRIPVPSPT